MIATLLECIPPGEARLVRGVDACQMAAEFEQLSADSLQGDARIVTCLWEALPVVAAILDQTLDALARSALALWPDWYGRIRETPPTTWAEFDSLPTLTFRPWLEGAIMRCRLARLPRPGGFAAAVEAKQLALAIEPGQLQIVLGTCEDDPRPERLLGLARAAEWLVGQTAARVAVLVPQALTDSVELDAINFGALTVPAPPRRPKAAEKTHHGPPAVWTWPVRGQPHCQSPGEQLLADHITADPQLGPLFGFNQPVCTVRDSRYVVDLVWPAGRIAVEVDGYRWHSDPQAFRQDRHRDYELVVSGYLVLRLTHDEVMEDAVLALEKIRDLVALRRRPTLQHQGADR
jgi:very-short-patch-repair endonuclease